MGLRDDVESTTKIGGPFGEPLGSSVASAAWNSALDSLEQLIRDCYETARLYRSLGRLAEKKFDQVLLEGPQE